MLCKLKNEGGNDQENETLCPHLLSCCREVKDHAAFALIKRRELDDLLHYASRCKRCGESVVVEH